MGTTLKGRGGGTVLPEARAGGGALGGAAQFSGGRKAR